MSEFKTQLDNAIKNRNHAMSKELLPKEALNFINSMLDAAIRVHKTNESMAQYRVTCADTLIRYFTSSSMALWDTNNKLKDYLLTNQLPE